jgi:serine/threonine-protein kinase RsbW
MDPHSEAPVEVSLPSILGYEKVAMAVAEAVAQNAGFSQDQVDDLKTAVSEACLNAIEHGNKQDAGVKFLVTFTLHSSQLQVDVADQGQGVRDRVATPRLEDKIAGKERSRGWGLFLIENLVDEVAFEPRPGGGHVTRLVIHLKK